MQRLQRAVSCIPLAAAAGIYLARKHIATQPFALCNIDDDTENIEHYRRHRGPGPAGGHVKYTVWIRDITVSCRLLIDITFHVKNFVSRVIDTVHPRPRPKNPGHWPRPETPASQTLVIRRVVSGLTLWQRSHSAVISDVDWRDQISRLKLVKWMKNLCLLKLAKQTIILHQIAHNFSRKMYFE